MEISRKYLNAMIASVVEFKVALNDEWFPHIDSVDNQEDAGCPDYMNTYLDTVLRDLIVDPLADLGYFFATYPDYVFSCWSNVPDGHEFEPEYEKVIHRARKALNDLRIARMAGGN